MSVIIALSDDMIEKILDDTLDDAFKVKQNQSVFFCPFIYEIKNWKKIFSHFSQGIYKNFGAPTMIVTSSKPAVFPGIEYANAACVVENMAIAATALGIDNVVWAGPTAVISKDTAIRSAVDIPDGFNPVLCISFGYGVEENALKKHEIESNRI